MEKSVHWTGVTMVGENELVPAARLSAPTVRGPWTEDADDVSSALR